MATDAKERQIPLVLILVGLALYVLAAFVRMGPSGAGATLVGVLIIGTVQTAILIGAAFLVAAVCSVSFGDVRSAILKFAAATLLSGGIGAVIPFGGIVALFVFLGLVMWLFEIELVYVIVLTVAYFVVSFGVAIALRAALSL
jgi:hypothetical protein